MIFWVYLSYLLYVAHKGNMPNLKFATWASAIFFALVHIGNYKDFDYSAYFYLVPLLVSPQFLGGLILGYIRLNQGMKWAIIFHAVFNALLLIPSVYFKEG
jgi:membrane protease YdiL (CAAX protease family)